MSGELTLLLDYDRQRIPAAHRPIERCISLSHGRWAVGQRLGPTTSCWRLLDAAAATTVGFPGWLWNEPRWFSSPLKNRQDLPVPARPSLEVQLEKASLLGGRKGRCIKSMATVIACLRKRFPGDNTQPPIALQVSPHTLQDPGHPARWFVLALFSSMPTQTHRGLRVGIGEFAPDPDLFDLIITAAKVPGFKMVNAQSPSGEGDDLVAYFLRNRLLADDPEAVEAASRIRIGRGKDPWGDAIAHQLRSPIPGLTQVSDLMIRDHPETAIRAITARLQAGADVDDEVFQQLLHVTLHTRDARPWLPLLTRPATERARTVQALLEHAGQLRPKRELVEVLGLIYPRGADINLWIDALMGWIRAGRSAKQCTDTLEQTLMSWPAKAIRSSRGDIWTEVVQALAGREAYQDACNAVVTPLCRDFCKSGASDIVIDCWMCIPAKERSVEMLPELVDVLAESPLSELAVVKLFELIQDDPIASDVVVREWCDRYGTGRTEDPLFRRIRDTASIASWIAAALDNGTPEHIAQMLSDVSPNDPVWIRAESALGARLPNPRLRFLAMGALKPGHAALVRTALDTVHAALEVTTFPDAALAEVCRMFIGVQERSDIWPWITLAAAEPHVFDNETIDATVVAFFQNPPKALAERLLAADCARLLGAAGMWTPFDHARWIVRMTMAPDAGVGFNNELELALVQGLAQRTDAHFHMEAIHEAMGSLEPNHPSRIRYLSAMLPAWQSLVR
jgi:hypothetical protein